MWTVLAEYKTVVEYYNNYKCTTESELAYAAAQARYTCLVFTHQAAALFRVKWNIDVASIMKILREIQNATPSIDAYLRRE